MNRVLTLSHRRHSGRPLPHHHTSYKALLLVLLFGGAVMILATLSLYREGKADSGSIFLSGIVPGPPPQTAPTIDEPASQSQTFSSLIEVKGSCLAGMVVVVARNQVDSGSATCSDDSRYNLKLELVPGTNDLVARQYDSLNQSSPLSAATTITLLIAKKPGVVQQSPSFLLVRTDYRFSGIFAGENFSMPITISGGRAPYAVSIRWGDGSSSLSSRERGGTYRYGHVYQAAGTYTVVIEATDADGLSGYFQTVVFVRPVITTGTTSNPPATPPPKPSRNDAGRLLIAWPIFIALAGLVIGFWAGEKAARGGVGTPALTKESPHQ